MSETSDTAPDASSDTATGAIGATRAGGGSGGTGADLSSESPARHEGTQFEPVPRAPGTTSRPYPPEADPSPADDTEPAQVPGEQTDPTRRADVFPDEPSVQ